MVKVFYVKTSLYSNKLPRCRYFQVFFLLLIIEKALAIDFYKKLKYFGWCQYELFLMNLKRVTNNYNLTAVAENVDKA